jgi:hypothetical protein
MLKQAEPIIRAFKAHLPADYLPDTLATIFDSYRDARETCEGVMDRSEMRDVLSTMRRALIETNVRNVARQFPTAQVRVERNARKTSHFSIVSFGQVDITIAKSGSPYLLPRPALYRRNLFEDAQSQLFDLGCQRPSDRLYALLIHGPARRKRGVDGETGVSLIYPAFARIVFPDQEGAILTSIDLFTEYRQVVHQFIPPVETVETAEPKPLRIRKKSGE